ncbi:MAG: radical SAM protein, partial [Chloroflexota bacterium]
ISQDHAGNRQNEVSISTLAGYMLELQDRGCHNINLVTPSHFVPQIVAVVAEAVAGGLQVPLVYNTSSYDAVTTLQALDGVVDVYMADLRYAANEPGQKYSGVADYADRARAAIKEMYRQVGNLVTDADGVARRGLIVRHLVLPRGIAGSAAALNWLAGELSPEVTVSVMSQYYPAHRAGKYPEIACRITAAEYAEVVEVVNRLGMENGWLQDDAAAAYYLPDFRKEEPFRGDEDR